MIMTITTVRVRRTCRAVRNGPGIGKENRMGRGREGEGDGKRKRERCC
jgi:hypothetical protein